MRSFRSAGRDPLDGTDRAHWGAVTIGGGPASPSSSWPSSSASAPNRETGSGPHGFSQGEEEGAAAGAAVGADVPASDPSPLATKSPQSSSKAVKAAVAGYGAEAKSPKSRSSLRNGAGDSGNATASIGTRGETRWAEAPPNAEEPPISSGC
jgi:hypothetical protein|uniref:Uncharacterized protein n=1 Tax=Zea mays TaxID=4577 RepID=A0A804MTL2_MAIZE